MYAAVGFTNRSLCARVRSLLGSPYTSAQMTYDLRRLRLKGAHPPAPALEHLGLTADGARVAIFYTELENPLLAADRPPASVELRRALQVIDATVDDYIDHARIRPAA